MLIIWSLSLSFAMVSSSCDRWAVIIASVVRAVLWCCLMSFSESPSSFSESSLERILVEMSFCMGNPNFMFLKTRQAMIFINATFGTVNNVRRFAGSERMYRRLTVIRLKVIIVLTESRNDLLAGQEITTRVLTNSKPAHLVALPWRTQASSRQKSVLWHYL